MHRRLAAVALVGAASLLTGCIATDGFARPEPTDVASASPEDVVPAPEATQDLSPYAVPEVEGDEAARATYELDADGLANSRIELLEPVVPGAEYRIEFDCRPAEEGAEVAITWAKLEGEGETDENSNGTSTFACGGPGSIVGLGYPDAATVQLSFTDATGVAQAWARFVPVH